MNEHKLPVIDILVEAFSLPAKHFRRLLKVGAPFLIVCVVLILINYFTNPFASNDLLSAIVFLLYIAFYIAMIMGIIGCHRTFLMDPQVVDDAPLFDWTGNEIKYVGWWIAIVILSVLLGFVFIILWSLAFTFIPVSMGIAPPQILTFFGFMPLSTLPVFYFVARWSLVLPSCSIGIHGKSIPWSWQLSTGNGLRLTAITAGMPLVLDMLFKLLPHFYSIFYFLIHAAIWIVLAVIEIGFLSLSYAFLVKQENPVQE